VDTTGTRGRRLLDRLVGWVPTKGPVNSTRVLVVDDDSVIRALIAVTLSVEGFEMFGAADGKLALALMTSVQPDIVILDAAMPEVSGEDVARQLHADPQLAHVKVLLLGAHGDLVGPDQPAAPGVHAWLQKPFEPDEIVAVVKAMVS
jgi:DNA-binding response OmpR family regulator